MFDKNEIDKLELGSKSYYEEIRRDIFFCPSYVQQHRLSTNWGKRTHGMAFCRKQFAPKIKKKLDFLEIFCEITDFPNFFADSDSAHQVKWKNTFSVRSEKNSEKSRKKIDCCVFLRKVL
jgi:hypothetical protein